MKMYRFRNGSVSIVICSEIEQTTIDLEYLGIYKCLDIFTTLRNSRIKVVKQLSKSNNLPLPLELPLTPLEKKYKTFPIGWKLEQVIDRGSI